MNTQTSIKLELDYDTLYRLFYSGNISISEFKCLDQTSKNRIWEICLQCCEDKC